MSSPKSKKKSNKQAVSSSSGKGLKYLLIVMVLLVYGKTINYSFVLDDDLLIRNHPGVQSGLSSIPAAFTHGSLEHFVGPGSRIYRPALISAFTIEHALFGKNAAGFHFISLLLYVLVSMSLYRLIVLLFPRMHPLYAFIIAALYVVHPVHSEVVANVKSQDELLAALGCLLSLRFAVGFMDGNGLDRKSLVFSLLAFTLALFSKESAVAFVAIFPLTFYVVRGQGLLKSLKYSSPFVILSLLYLGARHLAISDMPKGDAVTVMDNILFGAGTLAEHTATRASILFYYIKLLLWPHPLSWDYSYCQIPLASWSEVVPWLSLASFGSLVFIAFYFIRKQPVVSWGILFYLILIIPTSNLIVINLTTFGERFLFLSSAGVCVALAPLLSRMAGGTLESIPSSGRGRLLGISVSVLLIASVVTVNRCSDWKDNFTLFESGARNAPNSSRVQAGLASEYMNLAEKSSVQQTRSGYIQKSIQGFQRALEIYPENANAAYKLALILAVTGDTSASISYYRTALRNKPNDIFSLINIATIYSARQQYDSSLHFLNIAFGYDSLNGKTLTNLAVVHFNRGEDAAVVRYGELAVRNNIATPKLQDLLNRSRARSSSR